MKTANVSVTSHTACRAQQVHWAPNNFYCCGVLRPQSSSSQQFQIMYLRKLPRNTAFAFVLTDFMAAFVFVVLTARFYSKVLRPKCLASRMSPCKRNASHQTGFRIGAFASPARENFGNILGADCLLNKNGLYRASEITAHARFHRLNICC